MTTKPATVGNRNYQVKNIESVAIGSDMQARLFTLAPGDEIPWHFHKECTDYYFVLEGVLSVATNEQSHTLKITTGNNYRIAPGIPHRIANQSAADCRFLLIQGVGKCDWIRAETGDENASVSL
jgi:quercetin dioxygenase-like cupin family protein